MRTHARKRTIINFKRERVAKNRLFFKFKNLDLFWNYHVLLVYRDEIIEIYCFACCR